MTDKIPVLSLHIGTYEGAIMGFKGDIKNLDNYYNY